ncbi:MAG: 4-hydroxy-tetrahydrodipicolinate reductase [Bacillota bacterium]
MKKLIINGIYGRMGKKVEEYAGDFEVFGVDIGADGLNGNISNNISDFSADVVVDFSSPKAISSLLDFAVSTKTPLVICSTGFTAEEKAMIENASKSVPIFMSFNMSLGINVLSYLTKQATRLLADFNIEIVEKHHNQKLDAPSGTAIMLASSAKEERDLAENFGRHGRSCKREKSEIGMHAVRGGTVVGEHEVGFYGENERIILSHSAESRDVFAKGAIVAAAFMAKQSDCRMFDMNDVIADNI